MISLRRGKVVFTNSKSLKLPRDIMDSPFHSFMVKIPTIMYNIKVKVYLCL